MSSVSKAKGTLFFKNKEGEITKIYNGSQSVEVSGSDLGESYKGEGAIQISSTDTNNIITVSLDKAASDVGKSIPTASIADIIGMLGGTAIPPAT